MSNLTSPSTPAGSEILALSHAITPIKGGGMVLLLNTGAIITAEDEAMLQALHSRSPRGVLEHLKRLAEVGSGRFMEQFYVQYGHKSIADCGTITIFIEGVSMLAAKAIQDWLLYSGQECSTRYLDFSKQPFKNPYRTRVAGKLLRDLRKLYISSLNATVEDLKKRFPIGKQEDEKVYEKAIKARAFDICRSLLPAGATTNLTWHGNLRQTADKLLYLRHHPLPEVREIARSMEKVCRQANPNSFTKKRYRTTETYVEDFMDCTYYFNQEVPEFRLVHNGVDLGFLKNFEEEFRNRPAKTELPKIIGQAGTLRFQMMLDFGSFRDIQRQRSLNQRMPLLTMEHGFHPWYMSEFPEKIRPKIKEMLERIQQGINSSSCDISDYPDISPFGTSEEDMLLPNQYYIPMGFQVPNEFSGDIPALVYVAELRATPFVHPTLQVRAHELADTLQFLFGSYGLQLHVDKASLGRFDVRRGSQDITEKPSRK